MEEQTQAALEAIGLAAEGFAKANLTQFPRVDTGRLRNSVSHKVKEKTAYIGTNVDYAPYVEFGTGVYASDGSGRKTPWAYKDAEGKWHVTKGMKPAHFLKNAVTQHKEEYKRLAEAYLKGERS